MLLRIIIAFTYCYFLACMYNVHGFVAVSFSGELLFETVILLLILVKLQFSLLATFKSDRHLPGLN